MVPTTAGGSGNTLPNIPSMYAAFEPDAANNVVDSLNQSFAPSAVDLTNSKLALSGLNFGAFVSPSSASGNPVYFSTTGTLPAPLTINTPYYLSPNVVSGYDVYPAGGPTDYLTTPGMLPYDPPLPAQNFAQLVNKIIFTSQGSGTHTIFSDKLVYSLTNQVPGGPVVTIDGRNGPNDRNSHHQVQSDSHGQFILSKQLAREFGANSGNTYALFGKSPTQGPGANKFLARQQSQSKSTFWHTQVLNIAPTNNFRTVLKNTVSPSEISTSTGTVTYTNINGKFATLNAVQLMPDPGGVLPTGWAANTTYYVFKSGTNTFVLCTNLTDAATGANPVIPTDQGTGDTTLFAPARVADIHRQLFFTEQIEVAHGGAGNTMTPNALWDGLTNGGIIQPSFWTVTGGTDGDVLDQGTYPALTKVSLWFPPGTTGPVAQDTGATLTSGDYWVTPYTGGSNFGRFHRTLAGAQACLGVATVSCSNTNMIKYNSTATGEAQSNFNNSTAPFAIDSVMDTTGGFGTPQSTNPTFTTPYLPLNSPHIFTVEADMDPATLAAPVGKIFIDGVLQQTITLDGVLGISQLAQNDGQPAWTLNNSAASHVPMEGNSYGIYLGSSTGDVPDSDIIALHTYLENKLNIPMGPPVPLAPSNNVAPAISGSPVIGQTLTGTHGTWAGYPAPTLTEQWNRNGSPVSGATSLTYLLTAPDDTTNITLTETATNASGFASSTSASVGPVTGVPTAPSIAVSPVASGTAQATFTLSVTNGTWNGYPGPTFTYQWRSAGVNVGGATSATYVLQNSDVGNNVDCVVTGTNASGNSSAASNALGPVIAAPSYQPEAVALFARSGTSFTTPDKTLINNWFIAVKNGAVSGSNILAKLDTVQSYAVGTSHDALLDWANATRTSAIANGTGVVFVPYRGFKGTTGVSDWIDDTGYNPQAGGVLYTQNNATMFEYVVADATDTVSLGYDLGWQRAYMTSRNNTSLFTGSLNSTLTAYTDVIGASAIGSHAMTRSVSTAINVYHNGVLSVTSPFAQVSAALQTGDMTILTRNGTAGGNTRTIGFAIAGGVLTANEALDLHNACYTYLHAQGAV